MKKRQYLLVDQIIFKKDGWSKGEYDEFVDEFLELVENFNAQSGGGFGRHTEDEVDEMYDE